MIMKCNDNFIKVQEGHLFETGMHEKDQKTILMNLFTIEVQRYLVELEPGKIRRYIMHFAFISDKIIEDCDVFVRRVDCYGHLDAVQYEKSGKNTDEIANVNFHGFFYSKPFKSRPLNKNKLNLYLSRDRLNLLGKGEVFYSVLVKKDFLKEDFKVIVDLFDEKT